MIPLVDDFVRSDIANQITWLKAHPKAIGMIFHSSRRETLEHLQSFITNTKINIVIGYPRDQTLLPAYVIVQSPESEQPSGLGDNAGMYTDEDLGLGDDAGDAKDFLNEYLCSTFMNTGMRIECWSDNGDLTAMMYTLLKWCLWSSRPAMLDRGWNNITVSGTELEPLPQYMPVFIYRRGIQMSFLYDNLYFNTEVSTDPSKPNDPISPAIDDPTHFTDDAWSWLFRVMYQDYDGSEMDTKVIKASDDIPEDILKQLTDFDMELHLDKDGRFIVTRRERTGN